MASIFAHQYHRSKWVPVLAYGLATVVSGARVSARRHFIGDTIAGSAMGWFIGDYVYAKRHNSDLDKKSVTQKLLEHVRIGASFE
jgi:membrane-associated phospholipid phosphatase